MTLKSLPILFLLLSIMIMMIQATPNMIPIQQPSATPASKVGSSSSSANKYTCCMPRHHTVHAKVERMDVSNCNPQTSQCQFNGLRVIREKHMPDFYHRRYRLDLSIEMNGRVVSDETTMGFMESYPSNFGIEYVYNKTSCQCKQLTKQSPY